MNAEQLWDTTMNADTRTLLQVKLEDAVAAEDIFTTLMGENVEARRKFIEENALEVVNLDIEGSALWGRGPAKTSGVCYMLRPYRQGCSTNWDGRRSRGCED